MAQQVKNLPVIQETQVQSMGWEDSPGGNPLWYSCLKSPMDRGTWWATIQRVTENQTWLNTSLIVIFSVIISSLNPEIVHWKHWSWSWNSNTLATSCEELTLWKRPWCWEGLGAGGAGDDRGWDGWMASRTWLTWVWVNSGTWWWTGRPGVLRFMGPQGVRHDWVTELNWTEVELITLTYSMLSLALISVIQTMIFCHNFVFAYTFLSHQSYEQFENKYLMLKCMHVT